MIKTYAKWMTEVDVPVLVTYNSDDKDGQDSKKIFGFLKKVEYKEVNYAGKLWVFEHAEGFVDLLQEWVAKL